MRRPHIVTLELEDLSSEYGICRTESYLDMLEERVDSLESYVRYLESSLKEKIELSAKAEKIDYDVDYVEEPK